eukprot:163330_1
MRFRSLLIHLSLYVVINGNPNCYDISGIDYNITSEKGGLYLGGKEFNLKGVSWFGFETSDYIFHGLWADNYTYLINFMANYSFNAIRIPFSVELVIKNPTPTNIDFNLNPTLKGLTSFEILDIMIEALGDVGILVMFDMHCLQAGGNPADGLWYNQQYSANDTLNAWKFMVNRYSSYWNVIAADIFNEPFDATWSNDTNNNINTDINQWYETVGNTIHSMNINASKWLIFCEGTALSPPCTDACFWGEDLQGVYAKPIVLNIPNKVVYSPHCYGPSVASQTYFNAPNFPDNMPAIWEQHYGYIRDLNDSAVIVGEWGGKMDGGKDQTWMNAFAQWLYDSGIRNYFFWCLNNDSWDTGGLLEDDWKTPIMSKLILCQKAQPNPTKVIPNLSRNQICFHNS